MPTPPRRRWYQFGLGAVFGAITCFAIAAAIAAACVIASPTQEQLDDMALVSDSFGPQIDAFLGTSPILGLSIGLGIGFLTNRRWRWALTGLGIGGAVFVLGIKLLLFPS